MYNFDKIKVLLEAYRFTNEKEVYDALEANRIGVKILPEYKDKIKWDYACEKLRKFFKTCKELGIKDTTYGVQLLLSKVPPENLENIINTDGFYELLKSRNKQWVKELKEFKDIMNEKVWFGSVINDLHKFEKVVQDNQTSHGKNSKGSGNLKDVNVLYDDGTWKLMTVNTFEGAKAASFYNENGKEKTTAWCTRADIYYFNRYTDNGKNPLYIFRNLKNGKAYQMAFENEDDDNVYIHFLDQDDVKGDEITQGDFSKLPDNLLKLVKSPFGNLKGKSLLDYKKTKEIDPNEGKKGYVDKRNEKFKDAGYVDDKIVEKIVNRESNLPFEKFIERFGRIKKQVSVGGAMQARSRDKLNTYFEKGIKVANNYGQKAGYRKYFFEKKPDIWITIVAHAKNTKPIVYDSNKIDYKNHELEDVQAKSVLHYVSFIDIGTDKIVKDEYYGETIIDKEEAKRRENEKAYKDKAKKVIEMTKKDLAVDIKKIGVQEIYDKYATSHIMPKDSAYKTFTDNRMPGKEMMFSTEDSVYSFYFLKGAALKLENLVLTNENKKEKESSKELKEFALKLAKTYQRNWRRVFSYEVVQNRVEGNYKKIYEEKNKQEVVESNNIFLTKTIKESYFNY